MWMKNAGTTSVGIVRQTLADLDDVDSYIDDLIVHEDAWKTHLLVLEELFWRLNK